jgi:UDP-N-acetylglucosamine transferase subunit ALG13
MILVTVGTNGQAFDRLLRVVEELGSDEGVVVQHGPSALRPRNARCVSFVPFGELQELVRSARVVVTHAGVGSILLCLLERTRPVVVPRLQHYGEAVDDHQLALARQLAAEGLVLLAEDPASVPALMSCNGESDLRLAPSDSTLVADLAAHLRNVCGRTSATPIGSAEGQVPRRPGSLRRRRRL